MKPGYKTTEFWTTIVASILGIAMMLGYINQGDADTLVTSVNSVVGGILTAGPIIGYAISRGKTKST